MVGFNHASYGFPKKKGIGCLDAADSLTVKPGNRLSRCPASVHIFFHPLDDMLKTQLFILFLTFGKII